MSSRAGFSRWSFWSGSLPSRVWSRWGQRSAWVGLACLGLAGDSLILRGADQPTPEIPLREVRPFTPSPSKPAGSVTANIQAPGTQFPPMAVDPGSLVIRPGSDARIVAGTQPVTICSEPAGLSTRPLAYEDVALERLGQTSGPVRQPIVSAVKFYGAFPLVVPRGPQRRAEGTLGTTEPRYYGPAFPPSPHTITVPEASSVPTIPTPASHSPGLQTSVSPPAAPTIVQNPHAQEPVVPTIRQVAATEPIDEIQNALPGFRYVDADQHSLQPQRSTSSGTRPSAGSTTGIDYTAQREPATVASRSPKPADPIAVPEAVSVPAAPRAAAATGGDTVYVWYPTQDGGFIPVARKSPQLAGQAAPSTAAAVPVVPTVPAVPVSTGSYVSGRLPSVAQVTSEPVPAGSKTPPVGVAPPDMVIDGRSVIWDNGCPTGESCIDGGCCQTLGGWRPYVGVEATFFAPITNSQPLLANAFDQTANYQFQSNPDGASYLGISPRMWFGFADCEGRGIRFRLWQLDQSSFFTDPLNFTNPADTTGSTTTTELKAYTIDFEATREFCLMNRKLLGSIGVRYAGWEINESLYAQVLTRPVPDILTAHAVSANQFYGTGLTWGLQCIEPIYCGCCGTWDLFVGARGSALFGTNASKVATSAQVGGAGIYAISNNGAEADQESTLMIGEIQLGLQWTQCVNTCCGPRRFFGRFAFEYQYWGITEGVTTDANSFAGRAPFDQISITANRRDLSSLNMLGLTVGAGCYW